MYTPRLTRPESGNPYYNRAPAGYNPCIIGNYPRGAEKLTGCPGLNVLPNCVGYATGRFNEIIGDDCCKYLGNTHAYLMIALAKSQKLEVIQEPTLGGAMVWSKSGGKGHIAIVEKIEDEDTVVTSESEWNGQVFRVFTRHKGAGEWTDGCYWMGEAYKYLGCIKNPRIREGKLIYNTIEQLPKYAQPTIRMLCNEGIIKGSGKKFDENGYPADLDLTLDMIRILVWNDRAGLYYHFKTAKPVGSL